MKQKQARFLLAGLTLSLWTLAGCSEQSPAPAQQAQGASTGQAAKPAAQEPVHAPAAQPVVTEKAAASTDVAALQSQAGKPASEAPKTPATDPANARNGGKRYQGGAEDNKLETEHDLSKVQLNDAAAAGAHDEQDGHDHDAAMEATKQDGSALLPAAQAERNKGRIELAEGAQQVKDLGKLRQGESAKYDFPLVSKGEDALVISGVKPSCGCTKAEVVLLNDDGTRKPYTKGDKIPVGQQFLLESEISTDGKPGGPFNAQISIYGNDVRGAFNVRLTAEVEPVLTITPSQTVFFGRLTTADKAEQEVTVVSTRGEPFKLTLSQEAVQEPLKLEYVAKDPDAEGKSNHWDVKVVFGPNGKIGMNSYPLSFKTDLLIAHPKYPSPDGSPQTHGFMLNVQAQVSGMVSAEPSFLTFGMVRPGEPIERALRIDCHDDFKLKADMPVTFEGLQGQEFPYKDAFTVTVEPTEDGKGANLKVLLKGLPEDLNGSFGGVLKIKVGHPYLDELQIRFSGVCRPGLPATGTPAQPSAQPK